MELTISIILFCVSITLIILDYFIYKSLEEYKKAIEEYEKNVMKQNDLIEEKNKLSKDFHNKLIEYCETNIKPYVDMKGE